MTTIASDELSPAEVARYREDGFLPGPYHLCSPEEMAETRERIEREVLGTDPPFADVIPEEEVRRGSTRRQWRHLDKRLVYDLCAHPSVVRRMASLYGPDLILWRSLFFVKTPGGPASVWHQDWKSWPMLEPKITVTAWIAITEATLENSCMQLIPSSHKIEIPHIGSDDPRVADFTHPDPAYVDESKAVPVELKPGEFFLLDERVLHYAAAIPQGSNRRRIGLAVRVTLPSVKVDHAQCFPGHKVVLINGQDRYGLNETTQPPAQ
jgi:ectoine hydroxylase-related dioxygenase (phytanoyl-CoA dioxygenase family)